MFKNKKNKFINTHVLLSTLSWLGGIFLIFIVWSTIAFSAKGEKFHMPSIKETFWGMGQILNGTSLLWLKDKGPWYGKEVEALFISLGQAFFCLFVSFLLAASLGLAAYYNKYAYYLMWPCVTLSRALPTAVIMAVVTAIISPVSLFVWLIPIVIGFFILFPILFEGTNNALNNIAKERLEMANVFNVSKWDQFRMISLKTIRPYLFSSIITGFGLVFKIVLASQLLSFPIVKILPNYPSVGQMIGVTIEKAMSTAGGGKECGIILGWGIIAVLFSFLIEGTIKVISRLAMPYKYNDLYFIKNLFKKGKYGKNK